MGLLKKYPQTLRRYIPLLRRGGRRSLTGWLCRICMIYTFIHPIYRNQNHTAQAVAVIPNGTGRHSRGGLTCPPTPAGGLDNYVAHSGWICAMSALFQQPHMTVRTRHVDTNPRARNKIIKACLAGTLALYMTALYADDAADEGDCPIVMPNFDNMMLLTREERIQLMDQALRDALAQVQDCRQTISDVQKQDNSNSDNSNNSDNANAGADSNAEQADNAESEQGDSQNQQTATPSGELSGSEVSDDLGEQTDTRTSEIATPSGELSGTELPTTRQPENEGAISGSPEDYPSTLSTTEDDKKTLSNGKLPEDIPPADNDDIIAKQIREAALAEPDPQKQEKLWNEYRRYKGIPTK